MSRATSLSTLALAVAFVSGCAETTPGTGVVDPPSNTTTNAGGDTPAAATSPPAGAEATSMPLVPFSLKANAAGVVSLDLTFVASRLAADYAVFVQIGNDEVVTEADVIPQPGTSTWNGRTVLTVPIAVPKAAGTYAIRTGLYAGDRRLLLTPGTAQVLDDDESARYVVGSLTVAAGTTP